MYVAFGGYELTYLIDKNKKIFKQFKNKNTVFKVTLAVE